MRQITLQKVWRLAYSYAKRRTFGRCGDRFKLGASARIDNPRSVAIGSGVQISDHAWLNCGPSADGLPALEIGDGCYLGRFVHVNARRSVVIEGYVLIADRVFITDYHHGTAHPTCPIIAQPLTESRPVRLKEGCWIGEGAVIMPGVTIGRNAIVGANAVVTHDVPDRAVALGVPARLHPRSKAEDIAAAPDPLDA